MPSRAAIGEQAGHRHPAHRRTTRRTRYSAANSIPIARYDNSPFHSAHCSRLPHSAVHSEIAALTSRNATHTTVTLRV